MKKEAFDQFERDALANEIRSKIVGGVNEGCTGYQTRYREYVGQPVVLDWYDDPLGK